MSSYLVAASPRRKPMSRRTGRSTCAQIWLLLCCLSWACLSSALPFALADVGAPQPITGQLLVATPEMTDPRFAEAVIYIVNHDDQGAMGLIVNRPMAKGPIKELLQSFGVDSQEAQGEIIIYSGGPIAPSTGFVLHSDDVMLERSRPVKDGIAFTADVKIVEAIAHGKGPRQALVILGYAGWAPGQLELELEGGSWALVSADKDLVFDRETTSKKWRKAMDRRRISL